MRDEKLEVKTASIQYTVVGPQVCDFQENVRPHPKTTNTLW